jgi:hypothetical protein
MRYRTSPRNLPFHVFHRSQHRLSFSLCADPTLVFLIPPFDSSLLCLCRRHCPLGGDDEYISDQDTITHHLRPKRLEASLMQSYIQDHNWPSSPGHKRRPTFAESSSHPPCRIHSHPRCDMPPSHPSSSPRGKVGRQYNRWMIAPPSSSTAVNKAIAVTLLGENISEMNSMKRRCKSKKKQHYVWI